MEKVRKLKLIITEINYQFDNVDSFNSHFTSKVELVNFYQIKSRTVNYYLKNYLGGLLFWDDGENYIS